MSGRVYLWMWTVLVLAWLPGEPASAAPPVPACLRTVYAAGAAYRTMPVTVASGGVALAGRLFLPPGPGPHPAVVLVPGGGRKRLNEAPLYFAPLFARCGVAALVYDKRGTGRSGGIWENADFDDFVADAAAMAVYLQHRPEVEAAQVGLVGFSQGGRLAPVVAVRVPSVAFVVSVSAPFVPLPETRLYALEQVLRRRGVRGAALEDALALWRKHLAAVAARDRAALALLDDEIRVAARRRGAVLPPLAQHRPRTPLYNAMGQDFTEALRALRVPMLAVYGERDAVVPVPESIAALEAVVPAAPTGRLDLVVVPFANHSFVDLTFNRRIPVEEIMLEWTLARLRTTTPSHGATSPQ